MACDHKTFYSHETADWSKKNGLLGCHFPGKRKLYLPDLLDVRRAFSVLTCIGIAVLLGNRTFPDHSALQYKLRAGWSLDSRSLWFQSWARCHEQLDPINSFGQDQKCWEWRYHPLKRLLLHKKEHTSWSFHDLKFLDPRVSAHDLDVHTHHRMYVRNRHSALSPCIVTNKIHI